MRNGSFQAVFPAKWPSNRQPFLLFLHHFAGRNSRDRFVFKLRAGVLVGHQFLDLGSAQFGIDLVSATFTVGFGSFDVHVLAGGGTAVVDEASWKGLQPARRGTGGSG